MAPPKKKAPRGRPWRFSVRLTTFIFGLITSALLIVTVSFVNLYYKDKTVTVFESEFQNTTQGAGRLEDLLLLSESIDLAKVKVSKDILLAIDNPCSALQKHAIQVSDYLAKSYVTAQTDADYWTALPAVQGACVSISQKQAGSVMFINGGPRLMVPYLLVLFQRTNSTRIAMISTDGLGGTAGAQLLLILDREGRMVWSEDSADTTASELTKLSITGEALRKVGQTALELGTPGSRQISKDAIVAFAPVTAMGELVFVIILPQDIINKPVAFVIEQSILLILGFFFICLFVAKILARRLTKPLADLQAVAERLGAGDFTAQIEFGDEDAEFTIVKKTFNLLAGQIVRFMDDTREKAEIESEMKLAEKVQHMFIPKPALELANCKLFSTSRMAQKCGGDWWGYIEIPKPTGGSRLLLLIADATGHGTSAALLTGVAQGTLTAISSWIELDPSVASDPRQVITMFNRSICRGSGGNVTMSMFAAVIDFTEKKLFCCNAGHNHPYLIIPPKPGVPAEIKALGSASPILGQSPTNVFDNFDEVPWEPGYQLFMYTDGLLDVIRDGKDLFDRKVLIQNLRRFGDQQGKALLDRVMNERHRLAGGQPERDDVTVVVCS